MLRFVGYACVGAVGTAAQYLVLAVLVSTQLLGSVAASCIGALAGALVNYFLNYHVTFRSTGSHRKTAPRFFAVAALALGVNGMSMFALTHWAGLPWLPAQLLTTLVVLVLTYVASSVWTFRAARA